MTVLWLVLGLYTLMSIAYSASLIGFKKDKQTRLWEWFLGAPTIFIAALIGGVGYLSDSFNSNTRRIRKLDRALKKESSKKFYVDGEQVIPAAGKIMTTRYVDLLSKTPSKVQYIMTKKGVGYFFIVRLTGHSHSFSAYVSKSALS